MDAEKIKLIVFDIDGTLAETDDYYVNKTAVLLRKVLPFVKQDSMEKAVRLPIMAGETILHSVYRLLDHVGLDKVISKVHSKFSVKKEYKYQAVAGMKETLVTLSKNYIIGIITSGGYRSTEAFLEKFNLKKTVSYVISAEDCQFIKPHPMPLIKISEAANVLPENCILVGDTVFDILCAKRAGAYSVAVKTGFDTERFLKFHKADFILNSVNELPTLLASCRQDKLSKNETGKNAEKSKDLV
ncbi:MAG: HAD family hydrolase [Flexilinea sp.]|nr:HAD family hydrolase [Flexilinea sp.]